jgi:hypothetical protein
MRLWETHNQAFRGYIIHTEIRSTIFIAYDYEDMMIWGALNSGQYSPGSIHLRLVQG